ncbi:23S rRNA pseudouridine(1911/1915/1917) synthase RluD [Hydrogenovibrio marinus]|uniref:Pseudouridine synthase n=1 Tax=Hydrogenovibrio marinus TaxID=28885 RepID=A0A066ZN09_HYDMR|nr:23S rRNA pseudouridine(1911/1915/1917) synthase RluD [Hydrogenovibrio marinus]KDN94917.1 pseudouridine synthase [Hydrogenovibrio marinus]BBN59381.1 ribosomal large subunit pseudouridine synthase D [Hydrogenovibrio marinus]
MTQQELTTTIPLDKISSRLDAVLAELYPDYSRNRIQDWIKVGNVTLDGKVQKKPNFKVLGGEKVVLQAELDDEVVYEAQEMELDIIYEDDDILVINKPVGMVVHPGAGNPDGTLLNGLLFYSPALREVPRAGIVHRLDKDTSGLMVVAKTVPAQTHLVEQLQRHAVERVYDAVVVGKVISGGKVTKNIGRHPTDRKRMAALSVGGKTAVSHYRVLERFREHTHVRVQLETGRTHQIRVHMSSIGFPLVGDPVYGGRLRIPKSMMPEFVDYLRNFKRQALHAGMLSLTHPISGKLMKWKAPMPDDMLDLIDMLRDDMDDFQAQFHGYDEYDYDYDNGVEVEWVTDADIAD